MMHRWRRNIAATDTPFGIRIRGIRFLLLALLLAGAATSTHAQSPQRKRLILKDGTYQLVLSYTVSGEVVHYRSAERNGEMEDIPLALVDLPATEKWAREHGPNTAHSSNSQRPVLSPELAKEEADRAARTPEVAPSLRLPEETSVLVLDTFNNIPELVPLEQQGGDLNKETAHNVLKVEVNPSSSPHRLLDIPGDRADIQVHVATPVIYLRVGADDAEEDAGSSAITVDTHGAAGRATPSGGAETSSYVLEHLEVRGDIRVFNSFRIKLLGSKPQPDVVEVHTQPLPGGHWLKLTPDNPLEPGEYALVEVLSGHEVNLGIWDFGVHPAAHDNAEAIRPEPKRPVALERRDKE
ncbi:hypothetical protein [Granulicella sp. S156]|uniref:hypothetical protein n=1 Tax=Granulicella sp. S156 TaxID=1747224 RepID=UPI0020B16F76|nr:hypothetical protein [Granulicella sp. S156]